MLHCSVLKNTITLPYYIFRPGTDLTSIATHILIFWFLMLMFLFLLRQPLQKT